MSGEETPIRFPVDVPGADESKRKLDALGTSMSKAEVAYKKMAENSSKVAASMAALGGAARDVSPAMGVLGESVGRAAGSIQGMTAVLGGGAAGIAVGGVIAALGLYSEWAHKSAEATDKLRKSQEEQAKATLEQLKAAQAVSLSVLSPDAARGTQSQIDEQRAALLGLDKAGFGGGMRERERAERMRTIAALEERARAERFQASNAAELAKIGAAESTFDDKAKGDGTTAAGRAEFNREQMAGAALQSQSDLNLRQLQMAQDALKTRQQMLAASLQTEKEMKAHALDDEFQASRDAWAEQYALRAEFDQKQAKLDQQAQERVAQMKQLGGEAYKSIAGVGLSAAIALAKGHKTSTKEILADIGDQLIALGTKNALEGTAQLLFGNPAGAAAAGVGASEIVAGLAMGGGGVYGGSSGGKGSGGGSSGGAQQYYTGSGYAPMSPTAPGARPSTEFGNAPLTVNFHSTFAPSADDGVRVTQSIAEAKRQGRI